VTGRELERAARQVADQQTARLAEQPTAQFVGTVTVLSPLTVRWRGAALAVSGRHAAYTPAVNDRVACKLIDGQVIVEDRII
jgi:hypothetical protein